MALADAGTSPTVPMTMTVLWWSGTGPVSEAIQVRTNSAYCHVALLVGEVVYEAVPPAVHGITNGTATAYAATAAARQVLAVEAAGYARAQAWLAARVGEPYSDLADAGDALGLDVTRPGAWNCSALVAEALVRAGVLNDADERSETPGSLWTELEGRG